MFEFWLIYSFNIYLLNLQTWRKSCLINCLEQAIHNFEFDLGDNIVLKVWAKKRELQVHKIPKNYIEINRNKIIFFCNLYVHIYIRMKIYLHLHTFHYSSNDTITTNSLLFLHCFPILEVNLRRQSLLIFIQPFLSFLQKYIFPFLSNLLPSNHLQCLDLLYIIYEDRCPNWSETPFSNYWMWKTYMSAIILPLFSELPNRNMSEAMLTPNNLTGIWLRIYYFI